MSRDEDVDEVDDDEDDDEDEGSAELVERGTIRVDPGAAAEKLRDYQLPDALDFLVPWLRAAVASGASRVEAGVVDGALTFSFDGTPPDPAVREDLTAGLLQEDHGPAARHLAFGALALMRLAPAKVETAVERDRTSLRVRWPEGGGPAAAALKRLRAGYGMTKTRLVVDGEAVPDPGRSAAPIKRWEGRARDAVIIEDVLTPGKGRLRLYKLGGLVENVPFDLAGHYAAYVSDDRFTLALSQAAVVKDKRYYRAHRRLERFRRRLAKRVPSAGSRARTWVTHAAVAAGAAAMAGVGLWALLRVLAAP